MEYPKFKVCCRCFTFNHSKYITDAMNGFTMQQTSFPFVCCIIDDASTDGEQDVIRKYVEENFDFSEGSVAYHKETDYAHITYAQHKTNKNCYFAVLYLKENHYSQRKPKMGYLSEWRDLCEYEAICEGDDLWVDDKKLQTQYDFLQAHPDYVMCAHNAIVIENNTWYRSFNSISNSRELSLKECVNSWIIPTASLFISRKVMNATLPWSNKVFFTGDQCIIITCAVVGKIYFFKEYMSIYRHYSQSAATLVKNQNGGRAYVCSQLIALYESVNEGTEYKYDDIFKNKITQLNKEQSALRDGGLINKFVYFKKSIVLRLYGLWRKFIRPEKIPTDIKIHQYFK